MSDASEVRRGSVIRLDGNICKVLSWDVHAGGGKTGNMVHAKLRDLDSGNTHEPRFEPKDQIDVLDVEKKTMQYLFSEGDKFTFMDMESYDQIEIPKNVIGPLTRFLKENDEIDVEFFEGKALSVHHGPMITLKVTATGAGVKDANNYKDATLENDITVQVPQFIKEGDSIHVDIETGKYHDRVKGSTY